MKPAFPIRYKFLLVITGLLVMSVAAYLGLATQTLKKDKTTLVYELNKNFVSNLSSDLESKFHAVSDKLELFAFTYFDHKNRLTATIESLLSRSSDIAYIRLMDIREKGSNPSHLNELFAQTYGVTSEFFETELPRLRPVPLEKIRKKGEAIWNASTADGLNLIGFGRSVVQESESGVPLSRFIVIAYVRADQIAKSLAQSQLSETFVATSDGELLVHSQVTPALEPRTVSDWPLVERAMNSPVRTSVFNYEQDGLALLGAFAKSFGGRLIIGTKVSEQQAFSVVRRLTVRSFVFGLIVVTVAFIAAVLFSRSLTKPLDALMGAMEKVADGDLNTNIKIHSRDEIATLARSFNSMIVDLKTSRDQLEEINRDLEKKVKDRTRQLEEQNQAVKAAQEALLRTTRLAAVGETAGRAAHEVLNPLTNILTRLQKVKNKFEQKSSEGKELLKEIQSAWREDFQRGGFEGLVDQWKKPSDVSSDLTLWQEDMQNLEYVYNTWCEEQEELLKDADFLVSESQRINKIVSSMRSLSQVRGNRERQSAHQLLHECVNIMADLYNQHNVRLEEDYQAQSDRILVDKDEFIQSVTNLLRNSLQAVEHADRKKAVVLRTKENDGELWIEIEDGGEGIAKEFHHKLFESQFTTKSRDQGTGLGLSISRRFIRAVGGDIRLIESVPNVKTVFRITLPAQTEALDEELETGAAA